MRSDHDVSWAIEAWSAGVTYRHQIDIVDTVGNVARINELA